MVTATLQGLTIFLLYFSLFALLKELINYLLGKVQWKPMGSSRDGQILAHGRDTAHGKPHNPQEIGEHWGASPALGNFLRPLEGLKNQFSAQNILSSKWPSGGWKLLH